MKRTFTLVFALGLFTAATAQMRPGDNRRNDPKVIISTDDRDFEKGYSNDQYNRDVRYINGNPGMERRMARQVAVINREYAYKIQRVKNSFFMSRFEKQRQVRMLEAQRQREIRRLYARFHHNNNRFDDRDDRNDRNDRDDNRNGRY